MARFDHSGFRRYAIDELPLQRDIYMMDEAYLDDWEAEYIKLFKGKKSRPYEIGYITVVHASAINATGVDLTWYLDTHDRFHAVKIFLPKDQFVAASLAYEYDKRVQLFVKSDWLRSIHLQSHSIFGIIDAVDMTKALRAGKIDHDKLSALRTRLDEIAARHADISFISFADSLLLKTNWTAGMVNTDVTNTYRPEALFFLFRELQAIYRETLGLEIYGVFAQGANEYYDDPLTHISPSQNHISLNSLGLPFAQISIIETTIRKAIRACDHGPFEIYIDIDLFRSLQFKDYETRSNWPSAPYKQKMTTEPGAYFYSNCSELIGALKIGETVPARRSR
jgi:hypothetical protein